MSGPTLVAKKDQILDNPRLLTALQTIQDNAPLGLDGLIAQAGTDLIDRAIQCRCEDPDKLHKFKYSADPLARLEAVTYLYPRVKAYDESTLVFEDAKGKGLINSRRHSELYKLPFDDRNLEAGKLKLQIESMSVGVNLAAETLTAP